MDLSDSLGMLNSSIQFAAGQVGAVKDKKWIAKENQKSRDFQLEMWNKANEYNSPSKVLERYKMAGIDVNPNYLVTGNYQPANASLASAPGHSAPNMNSKDLGKYVDVLGNLLTKSQMDVNKSIETKNYEEAYKAKKEGEKISTEGEILTASKEDLIEINKRTAYMLESQGWINYEQARMLENSADFSDYYRETTFSFTDSTGNQHDVVGWQLDVMKAIEDFRKIGFDNQQIFAALQKLGAETQNIYKDIEVKDQSIKLMQSQEFLNMAQGDYYKSAKYLNYALAAKYNTETYVMKEMLPFNKFESFWRGYSSKYSLNLTDAQIYQLYNETDQAIKNNELDRYLNSIPKRFGTSNSGAILGFLYDAIFSAEGSGGSYYAPDNNKLNQPNIHRYKF